jgi:hypothetical protein
MYESDEKEEFRRAWNSLPQSMVDEIVLTYDDRVKKLVEWRGFDVQKQHPYK